MVVLDALHWIQGHEAPDLAVRWNCKAAKCGSCSAEVDGRPRLTCKTRLSDFDLAETITVEPMRAFPLIRDLVTDVSWNYEVNKTIQPFTPPADVPQEDWRWQQQDIERVQEYRKCIECFLCQDVCHVLRNHETERPFMGPALPGSDRRPGDAPDRQADRREYLKDERRDRLLQHHQVLHRGLSRSTSRSRTTRSSRSRNASPTPTTTRSRWSGGGFEAAARVPGQAVGSSCRCFRATRRRSTGQPVERTPDGRTGGGRDRGAAGVTAGFVIRTDGAARGNPGPASLGAALYRPRASRRP